ncbi:hypothetical protein F4818DRAFT_215212 [Hypoxylon cercidicola]|nr:hypothetical protein F4818DRAFT_215212 [Hypoxylon cercidicola]
MAHQSNASRDQRTSRSSRDHAPPSSYQPAGSSYSYGNPQPQPPNYPLAGTGYGDGYPQPTFYPPAGGGRPGHAQPPRYQPAAGGYGGVSHRESEQHRGHGSSRSRAESTHVSGSTESRRGHGYRQDRREAAPAKHDSSKREHRKSGRDADRGSDAHSGSKHGHSHHTSSRQAPMLLSAGDTPGGSRHHVVSHRPRHLSPIPPIPQAPRVTRLPTPNFDFEDDEGGYCRHNVSVYDFCTCCNNRDNANRGSHRG